MYMTDAAYKLVPKCTITRSLDDISCNILDRSKIIVFCTIHNIEPHVAPVWFATYNNTVLVGSVKISKKIKNIQNNPSVALCTDNIRITGTASISDDKDLSYQYKQLMHDKYQDPKINRFVEHIKHIIVITPVRVTTW